MVPIFKKNFASKRDYPVHFVGGVAFAYRQFLERVAKEMGFNIGKIVPNLQDALVSYYSEGSEDNDRVATNSKVSRYSFLSDEDQPRLSFPKKHFPLFLSVHSHLSQRQIPIWGSNPKTQKEIIMAKA